MSDSLPLFQVRFYEKRDGTAPEPWSRYEITAADLTAALKDQNNTTPRQGDILMIRSGYVRRHDRATEAERKWGTRDNDQVIGVKPDEEMVRWLYGHHFAAHVGDTLAFEAWPPRPGNPYEIHKWSLAFWGVPIGEMWNLEQLAEECQRHNRWTFFLTSAPLHVPGGVGSPPGAIAIF